MTETADSHLRVVDLIDVADARRHVRRLAEALGFRSAKVYRLATAVSELANNLHFHTPRGGTIHIRCLRQDGRAGLEVIAEDDGPGITDIALAMKDGYSTNGGLGGGLPGVRRLVDEFSIQSEPARGTRIVARMWGP